MNADSDSRREQAPDSVPPAKVPPTPELPPEGGAAYRPKFYPLWENVITIGGMYIAILAIILLLTFGLFALVSPARNPYVDIIGYLIIPVILAFGVALMPLGILLKSWRLHRRDPSFRTTIRFPRIDLNDPRQRRVAKLTLIGILLFLPILGVSSYHGYHYTDSTQFCANACHAVMEPQAVAFHASSHARVACAECHIGSGASWFVKSKLSGTRQVIAVMRESYSRPIPPAIKHLRPAGDTCEQCHWPNKFFGAQLRQVAHFHSDEKNTRRDVEMLVKTGGADVSTGRSEGIHSHMLMAGTVEYIAVDEKLQEIPWVRWVDHLGEELIYRSDGLSVSDPPPMGQQRQMDCMDCHNRPAHKFRSPDQAVNLFLEAGRIDTDLPFIKREAVAALSVAYPDAETARLRIVNRIIDFYRTHYPERYQAAQASVRNAADSVAQIYGENFFPYMKVDWRTYPDNIGHFESPGCFRCHDGKHVNQYGTPISHECSVCHTFMNRVPSESGQELISKGEFQHPYPFDSVHAALRCDQCHTGGPSPSPTCTACHHDVQRVYDGTAPALARFEVAPDPMAGTVACDDCHDLSQPVTRESINATCVDCHDDDEAYYGGLLAEWTATLAAQRAQAETALAELAEVIGERGDETALAAEEWHAHSRAALQLLANANPLHNAAAAGEVFDTITKEVREQIEALQASAGDLSTN
jgi:hypothetical protein